MLIQCTNCQSKIRVPESAAGRKGKCPKCSTVLVIPAAEPPPANQQSGLPPLAEQPDVPELEVKEAPPPLPDQPLADPQTAFGSTAPPPIPSSPPPVLRASRRDDEDRTARRRDEDDTPSRSRRDDDEDDEPRRGRRDDRDDRDGLNIRRPARQPSIGMSLTAMIVGITGVVVTLISAFGGALMALMCAGVMCPCGIYSGYIGFIVSGILGILGVVFGVVGLKHGGVGFAWTGIITGAVNLVIILLYVVVTVFFGVVLVGMVGAAANHQQNFNQQNFNQPNFRPPPPNFGPQQKFGPQPFPRR